VEARLPLPEGGERAELEDCVLVVWPWVSPPAAAAHRLRFAGAVVTERIRDVRAWFADRGRDRFTWWIGDSATPDDLAERLVERGAEPWAEEPVIATMLTTEPPPPVDGVDVVLADTYERFVLAQELSWRASQLSEEDVAGRREKLETRWDEHRRRPEESTFLALVDGKAVASGSMIACSFAGFLSGAATLPEARGRGAFRALVRARWEEAVRLGTPALVVGAGAMSRPFLDRLGFRVVSETRVLVDRSGPGVST
jgi:GNAT superfamily N-acetyltransferase